MIALLWTLMGCGESGGPKPELAAPAAAPRAEPPATLGIGRAATAEEIAAWDLDVNPRGEGLPAGQGTVEQGRALYAAQCVACHGPKGEGGLGPQLIGPAQKTGFSDDPKLARTIGNWWPHPTTIYDYLRRAMPQHMPGSLTPDQIYGLTAFLLAENGAVAPDFVATPASLPGVKMPTTVQFIADDRESATTVR